jgi:hypothetical protein
MLPSAAGAILDGRDRPNKRTKVPSGFSRRTPSKSAISRLPERSKANACGPASVTSSAGPPCPGSPAGPALPAIFCTDPEGDRFQTNPPPLASWSVMYRLSAASIAIAGARPDDPGFGISALLPTGGNSKMWARSVYELGKTDTYRLPLLSTAMLTTRS